MTWPKSLVAKVILTLIGFLIAWGVFFSTVVVTKAKGKFLASTGEIIRDSERFLLDITSKNNKDAIAFWIKYTKNTAATQEKDLKDIAFDLYGGDETRIKRAVSERVLAWKERSKKNFEIISSIRLKRVLKEIKTEVEKIKEYQVSQALDLAKQMQLGVWVFSFIAILSFILVKGLWLFNTVIGPIRKLSEGTKRVAKGDFTHVLEVKSKDELGVLADSFNQMTEDLQKTTVSKEYVENIIKSMIDTLVVVTPEGKIHSVNQATCDLLRYQPEELIDQPVEKIFEEEEEEEVQKIFRGTKLQRLMKRDLIKGIERTYLKKDGSKIPVLFSGSVMRDRYNKITGIVCVAHDNTERKKKEEELRKLLLAIEQSPAAVVVTDREAKIEYVNQKFTDITGYSKEEAIGQNPRILNSGVQSTEFYKEMWHTILSGKEWRGEFCNRKKNGELCWESASISPMFDELGRITHFVEVQEDITQKRYAAQELQRAKEDAEAASHAKSNFLASMSHELRTPLTAIIGFSDLLNERTFGPLNEKQGEYVEDILGSGKHLLSLINDILDLSKIEAGKMELELSSVRINTLIQNSLIMIKEKAMKHGIRLELALLQKRPDLEIQVDERMLKQIMFNLLSNATKFTPDGGKITVRAKAKGEDILISVSDTGIGIRPDLQENIFTEFYQIKGGMLDKTPGTGLGLPLTKQFVEIHGGKIWVESEGEGKGSCFSFLMPKKPKPPEDRKPETKIDPSLEINEKHKTLLNHLKRAMSLSNRHHKRFVLCRFHPEIKDLDKNAADIMDILQNEKRPHDFMGMDRDGYLYLILQETSRKGANVLCERIVKKLEGLIEGTKFLYILAAFPEDGETAKELTKKVSP